MPQPSFVSYVPCAVLAGGVAVPIDLEEKDQFRLTPEKLLEKITPKSKLLVLPFPNNPTGAIMTRPELEQIARIVEEHDLFVLSDEIYAELTFGEERHVSFASLPGMRERTVLINGFSKAFAMTGWRLGYACGPEIILKQMLKIHQFAIMCAPTTMGLECFEPLGAFYAFPSVRRFGMTSEEFATRLLHEERVAVVPGTAFGDSGEGYLRISYAYSLKSLKEALGRMEKFIRHLDASV